jgi:hypothetical protein
MDVLWDGWIACTVGFSNAKNIIFLRKNYFDRHLKKETIELILRQIGFLPKAC